MSNKEEFTRKISSFSDPPNSRDPGESGSALFPLTSSRLRVTVGFICLCAVKHRHDAGFTHLKLQKLLYYMQGFCLAKTGSPLFMENIEAWKLGPVVREVWYECKDFGAEILPIGDYQQLYSRMVFDDYQLSMMRWVYSIRGHLTGRELVDKTHTERPWIRAWSKGRGGIISPPSMARYFYKINS